MATIATFGNGSYNPSYVSSSVNNGVTTETWNKFTVVKDSSGTITWNDIAGNYPEGNEPRKFNVTQTTSQPSITYGNGDSVNITNKNGWYLHSFTGTNTYLGYSIITIVPTGPTVTSHEWVYLTNNAKVITNDTIQGSDFTFLKDSASYTPSNFNLTAISNGYVYDYTQPSTAMYTATIDSKSVINFYVDQSWTSSASSYNGRTSNSTRILNVLGKIPSGTIMTWTGSSNLTKDTSASSDKEIRWYSSTGGASGTDRNSNYGMYVTGQGLNIVAIFYHYSQGFGLNITYSSPFTVGAQATMSYTAAGNTVYVQDWVYSDEPEGDGYVAPVSTTSNGGGKPDRYPLIMTNLFNRNRSLYSIGMTHKDTWDLFL
jgi:hypothetical protein